MTKTEGTASKITEVTSQLFTKSSAAQEQSIGSTSSKLSTSITDTASEPLSVTIEYFIIVAIFGFLYGFLL